MNATVSQTEYDGKHNLENVEKSEDFYERVLRTLIAGSFLLAKLDEYGFDTNALKLIHGYLYDRKQRVMANGTFSALYS